MTVHTIRAGRWQVTWAIVPRFLWQIVRMRTCADDDYDIQWWTVDVWLLCFRAMIARLPRGACDC